MENITQKYKKEQRNIRIEKLEIWKDIELFE
jgi:hypothetical protein